MARMGGKVRTLRRRESLSQARFAERLGISTSYLNLIENDRRPLSAQVLIKLARVFDVDLEEFSQDAEDGLQRDLLEAFGDPLFEERSIASSDLKELASRSPELARACVGLYRAWREAEEASATLAAQLSDGQDLGPRGRLPSEEVTEFIQSKLNHFEALERAAEGLWAEARIPDEGLERGLVQFLARKGVRVRVCTTAEMAGAVRRFDRERGELRLAETLAPRSRNFQLAVQTALIAYNGAIEEELEGSRQLLSEESRVLARVSLANCFAGAVLMPYGPFLAAAEAERYDIELLGHRFRTSFEQVCHRLTSLRRRDRAGVPFHFIRVDLAGNISKRFSASGIPFARFGSACSKWNVFHAFMTPGRIRRQLSRMPDGKVYFCIARTLRKGAGGFHAPHPVQAIGLGCEVQHAKELVYSDGVDLDSARVLVDIGTSCRLCPRKDCAERAFPSLERPLRIDEDVRGASFFSPS